MFNVVLAWLIASALCCAQPIEVSLTLGDEPPDSGATFWVYGHISESTAMRGFTVYLSYDTNLIDLAAPPLPGPLIAGRAGLQFNYFDHTPFAPTWLEIGATVFSSDFWQGPGEIFRMEMRARHCADDSLTAPFAPFLVAADGTLPPAVFHARSISICPRIPLPPTALTAYWASPLAIWLRWLPPTHDIHGRPLVEPVSYLIYRERLSPSPSPPEMIAIVGAPPFLVLFTPGAAFSYFVIAQTEP